MKKKNIKLYNLIFPMYIMRLAPPWILLFGFLNYLIDKFVLTKAIRKHTPDYPKEDISNYIRYVWGCGYLADILGAIFLWNFRDFIDTFRKTGQNLNFIIVNMDYNPFANIYSFAAVMVGVIFTGLLIYIFNRYFALKNLNIDEKSKVKVALALAIFTAPYSFLIPTVY